jgi:hypothetical protein
MRKVLLNDKQPFENNEDPCDQKGNPSINGADVALKGRISSAHSDCEE